MMKNILLTGASGFLGSYVLEDFLKSSKVNILIRPTSKLWRISHLLSHPNLTIVEGYLSDTALLESVFQSVKIDVVCHLAWQGVGNKFRNDFIQVSSNLSPSLNLINLSSRYGVSQWVGLGSQAEYGPCSSVISESFCANPTTVYGSAKLSVATIGLQMTKDTDMSFCWLRLFSSYGPKDNLDWMYCYVIRTLLSGQSPKLTAGEQKWDYIYIMDAAKAISMIASTANVNGIYNLGSGHSESIKHIVEMIRNMIDPFIDIDFGAVPYRNDQVMFLEADIKKLSNVIHWSPSTSLEEGFSKTVSWHRSILNS